MNIGPAEIIVVLALALLVFGPGKMPQMGRTLGKGLREFKNAANHAKEELGLKEVLDDVNGVKNDIMSATGVDEIKASISDVKSTIDDAGKSAGLGEITAAVGSVKAVKSFDPRTAAKELVMGGKPSPVAVEKAQAEGDGAGAREPAPAAAAEETSAAGDAVAVPDAERDGELVGVTPAAVEA